MPISTLARTFAEQSCGRRVRLGRRALQAFAAAAVLAASFGFCLTTQFQFSVAWVDARLSVSADAAPLATVLREVAHQTGITIVGLEHVEGTFTGAFVDRPLVDGLELLLADRNHLIAGSRAARGGTDVGVWLTPRGGADRPADLPTAAPGDRADTAPVADAIVEEPGDVEAAEPAAPDEIDLRRLESSGFFDSATPSLLADTAHAPEAAVRAKALRVLTERDPSMAVDVLAGAMSDASSVVRGAAAEMLATVDGPDAQDSLGSLLQHADPVVRYTALELLRRRATDPRVLPYLQQALGDENEAVRLTAEGLVKELEARTRTGGWQ